MKVLRCEKPHHFEYHEFSLPTLLVGETLLRVRRVGVCGTDIHAFEGTQPYFNYPRILGHELAAEIVQTTAEDFVQGELVTVIPYKSCGDCVACRHGKTNCCVLMQVLGVHVDGGMAEYLVVPNDLLIKSKGLQLDELVLVEPLAISAHAIRRANVQSGGYVLVVGAGPIGLGLMEFARLAGSQVIALDVNESRLAFCNDKLRVEHTVNVAKEQAFEALWRITNGSMPTTIFDATGNLKAIEQAFQYLAHGGTYVLVGIQKGNISFSHPEFHKRESTLMSSRNATKGDFDFVIDCIRNKSIDPTLFVTHRIPFDDLVRQFEMFVDPRNKIIKAIVEV